MSLLKKYFTYKTPNEMAQVLQNSRSRAENNNIISLIMNDFDYFAKKKKKKKTKEMPKGNNKKQIKMSSIASEILNLMNKIKSNTQQITDFFSSIKRK